MRMTKILDDFIYEIFILWETEIKIKFLLKFRDKQTKETKPQENHYLYLLESWAPKTNGIKKFFFFFFAWENKKISVRFSSEGCSLVDIDFNPSYLSY